MTAATTAGALASSPWIVALAFLLGSLIGSFLNVVIVRLPAGESIVRPRSRCPVCGDQIPAWLNVPVLSWLVLLGRCRACRSPISVRYPIVEILTGALFAAAIVRFGVGTTAVSVVILGSGLIAITFIDLDCWEIPDEISLPLIAVGAALRPFAHDVPWYDGLAGAALGASFLWLVRWFFFVVRRVEGMGLGDVKLIAMIGAFVGPFGALSTILVASVTGTILGGLYLGGRRLGLWEAETHAIPEAGQPEPAEAKSAEPEEAQPEAALDDGAYAPAPGAAVEDAPLRESSAEAADDIGGAAEDDARDLKSSTERRTSEPDGAQQPSRLSGLGAPDDVGQADAAAEEEEEEEAWVPHPRAIPFGPFLAIGGLTVVFYAAWIDRGLGVLSRVVESVVGPWLR